MYFTLFSLSWPRRVAAVHGDVRFDENPILEPHDLQVFSEWLNDAGEVTERQRAIKRLSDLKKKWLSEV